MDAEPHVGAGEPDRVQAGSDTISTVMLGGFSTAVVTAEQLADRMVLDCFEARRQGQAWRPQLVICSNGQGIALAASDREFSRLMDEADIIHADGMPLVFASRLTASPLPERIATTDFFHFAARAATEHGLSFFILGATEQESAATAEAIARQYPDLKLVGRHHGYFGPDEDEAVCAQIRASGADVLWIGMGKPLQEQWSVRNRDRLRGVGWIKTCGGLFSFVTGRARRAPQLMQDLGLEWLYRLVREPRRLFWRYVTTNPVALQRLILHTEWSSPAIRLLKRILTGAAAPAFFALANFLTVLVLQQNSSAHIFGLFAFSQVVIAAGVGLSGALFTGPALVALVQRREPEDAVLGSFFKANLIYCAASAGLLYAMLVLAGTTGSDVVLLTVLGVAMWLRMFMRALQLATQQRRGAATSDLLYAGVVLLGLPVVIIGFGASIASFAFLQIVGIVASVWPMLALAGRTARAAIGAPIRIFNQSFERHGRWAVIASLANMVTGQGHSYLLTLTLGPAAYAPVALATLLFRPLGVVLTGLNQFERPNMAEKIASGGSGLVDDVRFVRNTVTATWAGNSLLVAGLALLVPNILLGEGYDPRMFFPALILISITSIVRALREPQATALQAAGHYRDLATFALICAPATLLIMIGAWLAWPGITWVVLLGTVVGELLYLVLVLRRYGRLRSDLQAHGGSAVLEASK